MNRNRMLLVTAIALALGLAAGRFVYQQFKKATAVKPVVEDHIVVAALPLALGTRLGANNLRVVKWPVGYALPGSFRSIDDCAGRAAVSSMVENEPVLEEKLAPKEGGAGLSVTIPEGFRALSVRVDDVVAVSGFVLPGSSVDVLVTGDVPGANDTVTRVVLEKIRVLAVGQRVEQDREGKPQVVNVITLLVSPQQATKLAMASTVGRIQLALRNFIDKDVANPPAVFRVALFGGKPPAPPAASNGKVSVAPPQRVYVVEILKGNKKETETFHAL